MLNAMSENHSGNAQEALRIIDDILAALETAGVRLVPVEPTDQMTFAAEDILALSKQGGAISQTLVSPAAGIWEAMLAASPYAKDPGNG